ncbi:hypothetical protein MMPV_001829 [Pyropia vietnamensis]
MSPPSAPTSPPRGSPPGSPVSSPTLARPPTTPTRPVRRATKRPRTSLPPRAVVAAATTAAEDSAGSDGDGGGRSRDGGRAGSTPPSPSKGVVKTRRCVAARRTTASVRVEAPGEAATDEGESAGWSGSTGSGGCRRRRLAAPLAVRRRLVLDFGNDSPDAGPVAVEKAEASVRATTASLSAAVADGFAARWDFDVRRGQPVESPRVWHWSRVEA